jgi:hypothetical protein
VAQKEAGCRIRADDFLLAALRAANNLRDNADPSHVSVAAFRDRHFCLFPEADIETTALVDGETDDVRASVYGTADWVCGTIRQMDKGAPALPCMAPFVDVRAGDLRLGQATLDLKTSALAVIEAKGLDSFKSPGARAQVWGQCLALRQLTYVASLLRSS